VPSFATAHKEVFRAAASLTLQLAASTTIGSPACAGSAAIAGLLFNCYGRCQTCNQIHIRFVHSIEELSRVGAQALHISALAFGVNRVKGKR
jgi:hypothetical protein